MFTGIVEERGIVSRPGSHFGVRTRTVGSDSTPGASVCVNGVCLTVTDRFVDGDGGSELAFDLSPETLSRSALGDLRAGDPVNLERAVTLLTRMGGHLVQGHVDGVGEVTAVEPAEESTVVRVRLPDRLADSVVEKGPVALDGVSLTVTGIHAAEFAVALVPYTLEATTLGSVRPGDRVNVEVDVMGKYLAHYVERLLRGAPDEGEDGSG